MRTVLWLCASPVHAAGPGYPSHSLAPVQRSKNQTKLKISSLKLPSPLPTLQVNRHHRGSTAWYEGGAALLDRGSADHLLSLCKISATTEQLYRSPLASASVKRTHNFFARGHGLLVRDTIATRTSEKEKENQACVPIFLRPAPPSFYKLATPLPAHLPSPVGCV